MNIEIHNIQKSYDDNVVLNIDKLKFVKHKIHGIIGPNGSGKSTLLKLISGLLEPEKGRIYFDNNQLDKDILKKITYVYQFPYMLNTTVYNNIAYPLKVRNISKNIIKKLVEKMIEELKITYLKDKNAKNLSGGESQKVALGRALVFNPKILLLDEPTSNLDMKALELVEDIITRKKTASEMTILIVTHNVSQAKRICDDIIYLENGKLIDKISNIDFIDNKYSERLKKYLSLNL